MRCEPADLAGLPCMRVHGARGASALVALHGAHVLSWIPADGRERLFLGERARLDGTAAIRGGIPVIFPQFAGRGPLPKHGFARTLPWDFTGTDAHPGFELASDARTMAWPHTFRARLRVLLTATTLALTLEVENPGDTAFDFTAALHTYLRVDALEDTALRGLRGGDYEDSAAGGGVRRETGADVRFDGEVDRIYTASAAPLVLVDGTHTLAIGQHGFADTVVWNPGAAVAATIGDLAPGEHRHFVCVEAAQARQPVRLAPGDRWVGMQRLG